MRQCPRHQVCHGPDSKYPARQRPGRYGPTRPLDDFTEVIRTRYPSVCQAIGNLINTFTTLEATQTGQLAIGHLVKGHTGKEDQHADDKLRTTEPQIAIFITLTGNGPGIEISVGRVENHRHHEYQPWHFSVFFQGPGIDKDTMAVMNLP